ncbi:glycosyltransferase, group 2 family protein, partial [Toxoplasma gondii CAST]
FFLVACVFFRFSSVDVVFSVSAESLQTLLKVEPDSLNHPNRLEVAGNRHFEKCTSSNGACRLSLLRPLVAFPVHPRAVVLTINRVQSLYLNPVYKTASARSPPKRLREAEDEKEGKESADEESAEEANAEEQSHGEEGDEEKRGEENSWSCEALDQYFRSGLARWLSTLAGTGGEKGENETGEDNGGRSSIGTAFPCHVSPCALPLGWFFPFLLPTAPQFPFDTNSCFFPSVHLPPPSLAALLALCRSQGSSASTELKSASASLPQQSSFPPSPSLSSSLPSSLSSSLSSSFSASAFSTSAFSCSGLAPTVSWLIPVRNGAKTVVDAVRSACMQAHCPPGFFDLVVVDDASTDETVSLLWSLSRLGNSKLHAEKSASREQREAARILATEISFPESVVVPLRIVCLPTQHGVSGALREGLKFCRGEFVARLDADDIAHPHRLFTQVSFMWRHPEVAVCGSAFATFKSTQISSLAMFFAGSSFPFSSSSSSCLTSPSASSSSSARLPSCTPSSFSSNSASTSLASSAVGGPLSEIRVFRMPAHPLLVRWRLIFECPIAHPTVMLRLSALRGPRRRRQRGLSSFTSPASFELSPSSLSSLYPSRPLSSHSALSSVSSLPSLSSPSPLSSLSLSSRVPRSHAGPIRRHGEVEVEKADRTESRCRARYRGAEEVEGFDPCRQEEGEEREEELWDFMYPDEEAEDLWLWLSLPFCLHITSLPRILTFIRRDASRKSETVLTPMRQSACQAVAEWISRTLLRPLGRERPRENEEEDSDAFLREEKRAETQARSEKKLPRGEAQRSACVARKTTAAVGGEFRRTEAVGESGEAAERTNVKRCRNAGEFETRQLQRGEEDKDKQDEDGGNGEGAATQGEGRIGEDETDLREELANAMTAACPQANGDLHVPFEESPLLPSVVACLRGYRTPATTAEGEAAFRILEALESFFCVAVDKPQSLSGQEDVSASPACDRGNRLTAGVCSCPCGQGDTDSGCSPEALKKFFKREAARMRGELATRRLGECGASDLFLLWLAKDKPVETSPEILAGLL